LSTLDFSKLASPKGETFEGLVRLLGERLGMVADWSGRGADGGRDLIFVETLPGQIKARVVRWLVSCKNNSDSGRSVTERDVGSVRDKLDQHKCDGFLLATTTTVSTGLKELLDKLDSVEGGPIQTKVWDRFELTKMLLSDQCANLLLQFFPEHQRRDAVAKLDAAREVIEAQLPRFIVGQVRTHLVPQTERRECLSGSNVWPYDTGQQNVIDAIRSDIFKWQPPLDEAVHKIGWLCLDAFLSLCDALIKNFPGTAIKFIRAAAEISTDDNIIYNSVLMLREANVDFTFGDELKITSCKCSNDTLHYLYQEHVLEEFSDSSIWIRQIEKDPSVCQVDYRSGKVPELSFAGGVDGVHLKATVKITASVYYYDRIFEEKSYFYGVEAHLDRTGVVFDLIEDVVSD
jgi:restriction endonuclease